MSAKANAKVFFFWGGGGGEVGGNLQLTGILSWGD